MTQPLRHYLKFSDLNSDEYRYLYDRSKVLKERFKSYISHHSLHDRTLAMIFEKNSTRTRLSFEAGIHQLGGHAVYLNTRDTQLGRGEPIEDAAQVISKMVDIIMVRTFEQNIVTRFAEHSRVPVINGLTNDFHPCQVFADLFTFYEITKRFTDFTVTWIGDANNMAYTWIDAAKTLNFKLNISTPAQYPIKNEFLSHSDKKNIEFFQDPKLACRNADIVTTDVWTSMGFEIESEQRKKDFSNWCVNAELMAEAHSDALFMHCLPAHRNEEVTPDVIDGPQSVVWDEAENRLHVQKALMEFLLLGYQDK